jgi:hypothetical protein
LGLEELDQLAQSMEVMVETLFFLLLHPMAAEVVAAQGILMLD